MTRYGELRTWKRYSNRLRGPIGRPYRWVLRNRLELLRIAEGKVESRVTVASAIQRRFLHVIREIAKKSVAR